MSEPVGDVLADLRSYYEREAVLERRGVPNTRRVEVRDRFVSLLSSERRNSVLDLGSGPATDAVGFTDAGMVYTGLDLAVGNARLAAARQATMVVGSIGAPPFRDRSFDAGWSMSTFMHVEAAHAAEVARGMVQPLRPGAPLMVGVWGGIRRDEVDQTQIEGERRLFSLRTVEENRTLLGSGGAVEHLDTWDVGPDEWEYQLFLVRRHD